MQREGPTAAPGCWLTHFSQEPSLQLLTSGLPIGRHEQVPKGPHRYLPHGRGGVELLGKCRAAESRFNGVKNSSTEDDFGNSVKSA